jgi:hypothetical protein
VIAKLYAVVELYKLVAVSIDTNWHNHDSFRMNKNSNSHQIVIEQTSNLRYKWTALEKDVDH